MFTEIDPCVLFVELMWSAVFEEYDPRWHYKTKHQDNTKLKNLNAEAMAYEPRQFNVLIWFCFFSVFFAAC